MKIWDVLYEYYGLGYILESLKSLEMNIKISDDNFWELYFIVIFLNLPYIYNKHNFHENNYIFKKS